MYVACGFSGIRGRFQNIANHLYSYLIIYSISYVFLQKAFKESPPKEAQPDVVVNAEIQQKEAMVVKFTEASGMLPCYSLQ